MKFGVIFTCFFVGMLFLGKAESEYQMIRPALQERGAISFTGKAGGRVERVKIREEPSIVLQGCSGVTIFCVDVRSILLENCQDVVIANAWIHDGGEPGIVARGCRNVRVQGCRIERVASGLYALESEGVQFVGNVVRDVMGPMPRGQMVQFDKVKGAGNLIQGNVGANKRGESVPEDMISIYESEGEEGSPIVIEGNVLWGDLAEGSAGKSGSGSGIMLGDGGGMWTVCRDNTIVAAGQVGIGVAGGSDIRVIGNVVYGWASDVANVGIYAWNQSKRAGGVVEVKGNRVFWMSRNGVPNGWWQGDGFSEVRVEGNEFTDRQMEKEPPKWPEGATQPPGMLRVEGGTGEAAVEVAWP